MGYHVRTNVLSNGAEFAVRIALGPSLGSSVIHQINLWLSQSGSEWTVNRLKQLRTAAIQLRAGQPDVAKKIYQKHSIAYYRNTLIPRGVYGRVFTLYLNAQQPQVLRRLEVVLRAYTHVRLDKLSEAQYQKAKVAINTPYQGTESALKNSMSAVLKGWDEFQLTDELGRSWNRLFLDDLPKVGKPSINHLRSFTSTHKSQVKFPRHISEQPYGRAVESLVTVTCWPSSFWEMYPYEVNEFIRSLVWAPSTDNDFCGHIQFIQELGAKARVVAVPSAFLQWGFEPLHDWLDRLIQCLPTSCVHDQNKGAFFVEDALRADKTVWTFDLSSATDRFPLGLQTSLLRALHLDGYAAALEEIVSEDWHVSTELHGDEVWKYECGQPMGLYGSFPLFSLTHLCLLQGICVMTGCDPNQSYRLLGDDVVITSPSVAQLYEQMMTAMGVEISPLKTVKSNRVAEFAGFIGYRTNKSVAIFRPYKYSDCKNIHNPLSLLHSLGSALGRTNSAYWSAKVKAFQMTRKWRNPDLSPLFQVRDRDEGVNPLPIDTTRLVSLLQICLTVAGVSRDTYTQEEFSLLSLEDLANVLLDKQNHYEIDTSQDMAGYVDPERAPMVKTVPLASGVQDEPRKSYSVDERLSTDPLLPLAEKELADLASRQDYDPPQLSEVELAFLRAGSD